MTFLRLAPFVLATLLLGAHFLRDGLTALVIVCVLLPFLLLVKKRWVSTLLQGYMLVAALVWVQTTYSLVRSRMAEGEPWIRMLAILSTVTAFTLWAGYLLRSRRLQERYPANSGEPGSAVYPARGDDLNE